MCYSSSSPRPVNSASNSQSDTTGRRSAVDQEDLKPYWKSEKRPHFSRGSAILLFTSVCYYWTLLTTERLKGQ